MGPITGGGGLISVPLLIILGLPPESAIASSRLGALGLWASAITHYHRRKKINWPLARKLIILGLLGGYCGSQLLLYARNFDLNTIIAWLLLAMLAVVLSRKKLKSGPALPSKKRAALGYLLFFCVMIFSGFFSGGDGTLGIFVLVLCFGTTVVEANATRGPAWFSMGVVACVNYFNAGIIHYQYAALLVVSMAVGANLGARAAISKGEVWVRNMLAIVVVLLALKLLTGT